MQMLLTSSIGVRGLLDDFYRLFVISTFLHYNYVFLHIYM